jgi:hypothetical protein
VAIDADGLLLDVDVQSVEDNPSTCENKWQDIDQFFYPADRVTPPSKLRIRFLYALRTISKRHNTFSDFISHFRSLFRIFAAR